MFILVLFDKLQFIKKRVAQEGPLRYALCAIL